MKGSLTVEASYIFPFCLLVIGVICCLGVFQYNRAVLKMTGYECILQTLDEGDSPEEVFRETLIQRARQTGEERTLGVRNLGVSAQITSSKISVTFSGMQTMLNIPLEATVVYERTFPELILRLL